MQALVQFDPIEDLPEGVAVVPDASMAMAWLDEHEAVNVRVYYREGRFWQSRGWYDVDSMEIDPDYADDPRA